MQAALSPVAQHSAEAEAVLTASKVIRRADRLQKARPSNTIRARTRVRQCAFEPRFRQRLSHRLAGPSGAQGHAVSDLSLRHPRHPGSESCPPVLIKSNLGRIAALPIGPTTLR